MGRLLVERSVKDGADSVKVPFQSPETVRGLLDSTIAAQNFQFFAVRRYSQGPESGAAGFEAVGHGMERRRIIRFDCVAQLVDQLPGIFQIFGQQLIKRIRISWSFQHPDWFPCCKVDHTDLFALLQLNSWR
jgi:hypothetical protein